MWILACQNRPAFHTSITYQQPNGCSNSFAVNAFSPKWIISCWGQRLTVVWMKATSGNRVERQRMEWFTFSSLLSPSCWTSLNHPPLKQSECRQDFSLLTASSFDQFVSLSFANSLGFSLICCCTPLLEIFLAGIPKCVILPSWHANKTSVRRRHLFPLNSISRLSPSCRSCPIRC